MAIQSKSKDKLLVLKEPVTKEMTSGLSVVGSAIAATATHTVPVYDEDGNLLGHMALFDTADLT